MLCALRGIISRDQCAVVVVSDVFIAAYDVAVIGDGGVDVIAAVDDVDVDGAPPPFHLPQSMSR